MNAFYHIVFFGNVLQSNVLKSTTKKKNKYFSFERRAEIWLSYLLNNVYDSESFTYVFKYIL